MKSLSEIETTSKRASRAIGFPWGIAEEVGKSIRLLELFGFQGIKSLNQYYQSKNKENFENIRHIKQDNSSNKIPFCPILLGISFLDQVKSLETFKKCSFKEIAYPLLFLPFLSRSSEIVGKKILFTFDDINFLLNFNINISSSLFDTNLGDNRSSQRGHGDYRGEMERGKGLFSLITNLIMEWSFSQN